MHSRQVKPITITTEQIKAAAAKIAASDSDANGYSESTQHAAVETWLRRVINNILADPEHCALGPDRLGNFDYDPDCAMPGCVRVPRPNAIYCQYHEELELERAAEERATAIPQSRRELTPEPDGDVLWA